MKHLFCSYEQSLALKELGFDEECLGVYDENIEIRVGDNIRFGICINAPLKQQVFKWFRDKKLSDGSINRHGEADGGYSYRWEIVHEYGVYEERHFKMGYKTYEEAEDACIDKLIELIKSLKQPK